MRRIFFVLLAALPRLSSSRLGTQRDAERALAKKKVKNDGKSKAKAEIVECGPGGDIPIAGSPELEGITTAWFQGYNEACPETFFVVEPGTSESASRRVCTDSSLGESEIWIGTMDRKPAVYEATTRNDWLYKCAIGDTERSTILIDVALDALAIIQARGSVSEACIESLPEKGLSLHQLRWIFSDYTESQLLDSGWNSKHVPNSDGDDSTHLWSELGGSECPSSEITVAAASDIADLFSQTIFFDSKNGESFRGDLMKQDEVVKKVLKKKVGLGIVGFNTYEKNIGKLGAVAIANDDDVYVIPTVDTISAGAYKPLSRRLYMNLPLEHLESTSAFIAYGLSNAGSSLAKENGLLPIPAVERALLHLRIIDQLSEKGLVCRDGPPATVNDGFEIIPREGLKFRRKASVDIAGSKVVSTLATGLAEGFSKVCPNVKFNVERGSSSAAAKRVCADVIEGETPVQIATMSRQWHPDESEKIVDSSHYKCRIGNTDVTTVQTEVGFEAFAIVQKLGSASEECISSLKNEGMTVEQLRWIFSSYSEKELEATGWDRKAIEKSDGNDETHLWSELSSSCPDEEIFIAVPSENFFQHKFLVETLFLDFSNGEGFRAETVRHDDEKSIVNDLLDVEAGLGLVSFPTYNKVSDKLTAVAVENFKGDFVEPSSKTIHDGSYTALTRKMYMNFLFDNTMIETAPFFAYGMSDLGTSIVKDGDVVSISEEDRVVMSGRITVALSNIVNTVC